MVATGNAIKFSENELKILRFALNHMFKTGGVNGDIAETIQVAHTCQGIIAKAEALAAQGDAAHEKTPPTADGVTLRHPILG